MINVFWMKIDCLVFLLKASNMMNNEQWIKMHDTVMKLSNLIYLGSYVTQKCLNAELRCFQVVLNNS